MTSHVLDHPTAPRFADPPPRRSSRRPRRLDVFRTISRVLVALLVVLQVYPLLWLLLTSVRDEHDFTTGNPFGLPHSFTLDNYSRAFGAGDLGRYVLNSVIVTGGADLLIVICGMMGAYALTVLGFRGSGLVRGAFLLGIIVPVQVALVPLFIDYSKIGLLDTYQSMIIPLADGEVGAGFHCRDS